MTKRSITLLLLIGLCILFACGLIRTQEKLESALGKMTYQDAIDEWGPPAACIESGQIMVCQWVKEHFTYGVYSEDVLQLSFRNNVLYHVEFRGEW